MRADSFLGQLVPAISRRTPAYSAHDCRPAIAAELRAIASEIDPSSDGCHREDADLLLRRADELDPQGGGTQ